MEQSKILALKYRPQNFEDLIGQEVVSKTITSSIKTGKTPNAYLLHGIRGVGKTTTARLIAKALNCKKNESTSNECSKEKPCASCREISNSSHIDVLEMDAASKTGIDDVRELIENSKYSPTSSKYKIFIIDEVHMLSKQAFNGLLKTLEEPPPSLKFILATTEVRKIPVTVLSRCQRFDLKRVGVNDLVALFEKISKIEKIKINRGALKIIAIASEGSVRDGLSLLDRASVSQDVNSSEELDEKEVRKMLGLIDKTYIIELLKETLKGDQKKAIEILNNLFKSGLDGKNLLNDMLQIINLFSRRITLGPIENDLSISESEMKLINHYSENLDVNDLNLFWQITIKTLNDINVINDEYTTLEMYLQQLCHIQEIKDNDPIKTDKPENKVLENLNFKSEKKFENENDQSSIKTKNQLKNAEQIKSSAHKNIDFDNVKNIHSYDELIELVTIEKEVELKFDLERNVNLVNFENGKIDISFNENLKKNFVKNLSDKLYKWTSKRWIISLSQTQGQKTIKEKSDEIKKNEIKKFNDSEITKRILSTFPDATLTEIKDIKKDE